MDLFVQFQCCFFSFLCGFCMLGVYHLFHRLLWYLPFILKGICHFCIGVFFAFLFFKGLVFLNYGVLYIYEFIFLFLGYLVYQRFYAYYELLVIEKVILLIKKIIHPFVFFLKKINAIIKRRVRKVLRKWQKENQDS